MGGAARYSLSALSRHHRIALCNGLQMGAARTSNAREVDSMRKRIAYGFDQGATRDVGVLFIEETSKTLANGSCPGHHNGVVICYTIDEKMGNTYIHEEQANTLAQRDYKQPQAVIYETADSSGIKSKPCNDNK